MKMINLNSRLARRATATLALGLLLGAQTAMACTVDNWNGGNSGNVTAGGPNSGGIARYAGICSMETPSAANAWVQDDSPGGIDRIRARFYVRNGLSSGASLIYRGFSTTGGTGQLFTVFLNSAGSVTLIDNATGTQVQQAGNTAWSSVEIDWSQGAGDGFISLSVNGQTPAQQTGLANAGAGLQSVRLGNLNSAAGTLGFDAYESRRTTEIGRLCRGNPDADGTRDINDLQVLFTELQTLGGTPAPGTPDANEDGSVGLPDLNVIFGFIQALQGDCSAFLG